MPEILDKVAEWAKLKRELRVGQILEGKVLAHWPFGIFVDIARPFVGLVEIVNFKESGERMTPVEYPEIGQRIRCVIVQFSEHNHQVRLSVRPSDLQAAGA